MYLYEKKIPYQKRILSKKTLYCDVIQPKVSLLVSFSQTRHNTQKFINLKIKKIKNGTEFLSNSIAAARIKLKLVIIVRVLDTHFAVVPNNII